MLIGAMNALPLGLGDVAGETRIPRSLAAEIGTAVGQVRRRSSHGGGSPVRARLQGSAFRIERPRVFRELLAKYRQAGQTNGRKARAHSAYGCFAGPVGVPDSGLVWLSLSTFVSKPAFSRSRAPFRELSIM